MLTCTQFVLLSELISPDSMTFTAMTPDDAVFYGLIHFSNAGKPKDRLRGSYPSSIETATQLRFSWLIQAPNVRSLRAHPHTLNITLHVENSDHNPSI